jgi:parallel beta-helix repeat protein
MKKLFLLIFTCQITITNLSAQISFQKETQKQFILVENGATINLPEGSFLLSASLSLQDKQNITIKGAGIDKTILSFKGQTEGAEGLRVTNCNNIILEGITVLDTKGDAIKTMNVKGITFKNIKTEWTGKPKKENGAYGIYPVQCENVIIDACQSIGASDAGIYVGQSKNIVVKNCRAYHNVAGIEIENSLNAEVYDNEATENTGGILVFDLPDLVQKKGGFVKVFRNNIHHNNYPNFAPKANIVGTVPDGTGLLILATNNVEVYDNLITNNRTVGTGVISYFMSERPINDKDYYPYPKNIKIFNNTFARENVRTTSRRRMGKMYRFKLKFGKQVPDIQWDGIEDLENKAQAVCIKNNKNATFANLDAANNFKNISKDESRVICKD